MGTTENEMRRLLVWLKPDDTEKMFSLQASEDKFRFADKLLKRFEREKQNREREAYYRSCLGKKIWVNLDCEDTMCTFEGEVTRLEMKDGRLLMYMASRKEVIDFFPDDYYPHILS